MQTGGQKRKDPDEGEVNMQVPVTAEPAEKKAKKRTRKKDKGAKFIPDENQQEPDWSVFDMRERERLRNCDASTGLPIALSTAKTAETYNNKIRNGDRVLKHQKKSAPPRAPVAANTTDDGPQKSSEKNLERSNEGPLHDTTPKKNQLNANVHGNTLVTQTDNSQNLQINQSSVSSKLVSIASAGVSSIAGPKNDKDPDLGGMPYSFVASRSVSSSSTRCEVMYRETFNPLDEMTVNTTTPSFDAVHSKQPASVTSTNVESDSGTTTPLVTLNAYSQVSTMSRTSSSSNIQPGHRHSLTLIDAMHYISNSFLIHYDGSAMDYRLAATTSTVVTNLPTALVRRIATRFYYLQGNEATKIGGNSSSRNETMIHGGDGTIPYFYKDLSIVKNVQLIRINFVEYEDGEPVNHPVVIPPVFLFNQIQLQRGRMYEIWISVALKSSDFPSPIFLRVHCYNRQLLSLFLTTNDFRAHAASIPIFIDVRDPAICWEFDKSHTNKEPLRFELLTSAGQIITECSVNVTFV